MSISINALKKSSIPKFVAGALIAMSMTACSTLGGGVPSDKELAQRSDSMPALTERQLLLENGYSQMYDAVKGLAWTDEIFLVKFETDRVETFGKNLAEAASQIGDELEMLAAATPWITLENDGLPEIENLKLEAVRKDRLESFLPLVGRSQSNFERTLLLSNSGALNQMQHLAEVLLEIETDPDRLAFLEETQSRFSDLYEDDILLLNEDYFCDNTAAESVDFR
jgi:hypothetical protein